MQVLKSRKNRLRECEKVLAEHLEDFVKVGLALKEIRNDGLYDEVEFSSFEDYLRKKWDLSGAYASRLIAASDLRVRLPKVLPMGKTWTERSVRDLRRLRDEDGKIDTPRVKVVVRRIMEEVKTLDNGRPIGPTVRKHVKEELGEPSKPDLLHLVERWCESFEATRKRLENAFEEISYIKRDRKLARRFKTACENVSKTLSKFARRL